MIAAGLAILVFIFSTQKAQVPAQNATSTQELPMSTRTPEISMGGSEVRIGASSISVDVADTPSLREQGLSGRKSLCADCGMLFIFEKPGRPTFWMKDMNFAIDIVWIDGAGKVVTVHTSLAPETYPETFAPSKDILYVLELPAGFVEAHGIRVGDSVSILLS